MPAPHGPRPRCPGPSPDALTGAGHAREILEATGRGPYAFAECRVNGATTVWGAAKGPSPPAASVGAVLSAVNRA
ncbi:hypothetical protein [Streptomyces sp. NPDC001714]|uniref:hypothetical protein n=1 Tax=Streptomyces sp. NPDC001714 TaxID=3364603 RepID=UPI00368DF877